MFETLFGSEIPLAAKFFIAFAVVLALIGLTAWLVRRFGANRLGGAARGRQPRLAVIDAATVDGRRRLVLIRRDNVEHLLMIGGPTDVVVEPNIVRATGGVRETAREPARAGEPARAAKLERRKHLAAAAGRASRRRFRRRVPTARRRPKSLGCRPSRARRARPADSLTGARRRVVDDPAQCRPKSQPLRRAANRHRGRASRPRCRRPLSRQSRRRPITTSPRWRSSSKPRCAARPMPESRPPVTDPLASVPAKAAPTRDFKPRLEPKFELASETKLEPKMRARGRAEGRCRRPRPSSNSRRAKDHFDNLEEEMASLLGRPPGKT